MKFHVICIKQSLEIETHLTIVRLFQLARITELCTKKATNIRTTVTCALVKEVVPRNPAHQNVSYTYIWHIWSRHIYSQVVLFTIISLYFLLHIFQRFCLT